MLLQLRQITASSVNAAAHALHPWSAWSQVCQAFIDETKCSTNTVHTELSVTESDDKLYHHALLPQNQAGPPGQKSMNTPHSVKLNINAILSELPNYGSFTLADVNAERDRVRAILAKIVEKRSQLPQLSAFEEKILAKALNVYEAYVDTAIQRKQTGEVIIRPLHTIASIQPEQIESGTNEHLWIKSVLKTRYPLDMSDELILKLESVRDCNFRLRMEEGYTNHELSDLVGLAHSEHFKLVPEGYLSRDEEGIPRLFSTARSTVPLALDMHNVVRIEFANRNHGGEIWRHPAYQENDACFSCLEKNGFLLRSQLTDGSKKNGPRYHVKVYDQGKLVFDIHDFQPLHNKQKHAENEHVLTVAALEELITNIAAEKYLPLQASWLLTPRAGNLADLTEIFH